MFYSMKLNNYIFNIFFALLIIMLNVQSLWCDEYKVKIIAKVNGSPITSFDIEERLNIFLYEAQLEKNDANKNKFFNEVLDSLIEEELTIQEAVKISSSIYNRAELQAQKLIESNFGPGDENIENNLKSYGVSIQHIKKFFTADILLASIIKNRHEREFDSVEEKVQKKIKSLNLSLKENHYKLSELKISPNTKIDPNETLKLVNEIIQEINKGANFNSLAKQFSSAKSKINNGKLGWIKETAITKDILKIIQETLVGQITQPIKIDKSYVIYRLEGKLIDGERDKREDVLELIKLTHPVNSVDENEILKIKEKIIKDLEKITNCDDLKTLHLSYGNENNVEEARKEIFNLSYNIKREVMFLSDNQFTQPILSNDGYVVLMVCKRYLPEIKFPSEEKLKQEIENELFVELSERYISRLRRSSYIEIIN